MYLSEEDVPEEKTFYVTRNDHEEFDVSAIKEATFVAVPQGVNNGQRIGDSIFATRLLLTGEVGLPPQESLDLWDLGTVNDGVSKIVVVLDKQPHGTAPTVTDIYIPNTSGDANNYAHLQWDNRDRFQILAEKTIVLPAAMVVETVLVEGTNIAVSNRVLRPFEMDIPLNFQIKYDDEENILTNNVLLVMMNNYQDLTTVRYYSCLYYVDY